MITNGKGCFFLSHPDGHARCLKCIMATSFSFIRYSILRDMKDVVVLSVVIGTHQPQGGTLIFSYIRRLGSFLGVQNFEFQYFLLFSEK